MDRTPYLGLVIALASVIACGGGPDCKNPCSAVGTTQCSGTQVQTCRAESNGCLSFSAPAPCGFQQFCSATSNSCIACVNTCPNEGATQCTGTQVQTCTADANGCLAYAAPTTCPAGQSCVTRQNRCLNDAGLACPSTPAVLSAASPAGPATDPGTCVRPVVTSALPAGQVNHLSVHQVGEVVPFEIPAGTGGFSIVSQAVNAQTADVTFSFGGQSFTVPNSVVPLLVTDPAGATFFDDNANVPADPSGLLAVYDDVSPSTGAFSVPNTSAALSRFTGGVPSGTWHVTVSDFANECATATAPLVCVSGGDTTSTYDVTVVTRPGPVPAQAPVDVGIYLVTNSFTAATAVADPGMTRLVSTMQSIYSRAGLCLGTVTFYDVPAWAKAKFATGVSADATGPCDDLDQMFTLSVPGNALNFFFVDDITQPGTTGVGTVVGIDGTIPGPSSFGGTVHSGAVVNASNIGKGVCPAAVDFGRCGSDVTAYIAAHEGGHYMGLYHTTEAFGNFFDPIADTGKCPCNQCAPLASRPKCASNNPTLPPGQVPTEVLGTDCNKGGTCDGSQYLMFWIIDDTSFGDVSPQQGQIVRANPVTH